MRTDVKANTSSFPVLFELSSLNSAGTYKSHIELQVEMILFPTNAELYEAFLIKKKGDKS